MASVFVAPSLLASDFGFIDREVRAVTKAGADWIHLDVMDGYFVPPITFGADVAKVVRRATDIPLDVHLMITNPDAQLEAFAHAGASFISVHVETCPHLHRTVQRIKQLGARPGVVLNPGTPVSALGAIIDDVDLVLVMSVNPGWGGQKFIPQALPKIRAIRELAIAAGRNTLHIEVDGGINQETGRQCIEAGADVLVAGTFVFGAQDYAVPIRQLRAGAC